MEKQKTPCSSCGKEFLRLAAHKCNKVLKAAKAPKTPKTPKAPKTLKAAKTPKTLKAPVASAASVTTNTVVYESGPVIPPGEKNAISLFSGAGGDTLGIERAGYKVVAFNEFNEAARTTHLAQFPTSHRISHNGNDDIRTIPDSVFEPYKGNVNIVFAGFPCQGFSHGGKKNPDDPRNELVYNFAKVASIVRPKWIIGENVKGLLARKGRAAGEPKDSKLRPVIDIIVELFERTGYKVTYKLIDVSTIGVPQRRKRLILVGHLGDTYPHMPWTDLTAATTPSHTAIRSFLEPHLEGAMELPNDKRYTPSTQDPKYWIPTTATAATEKPHNNLMRLVEGRRNPSSKEKAATPPITGPIVEPDGLISFGKRSGGYHGMVVDPDKPCSTIISTYNLCPRLFVGLHNKTTGKYWIRCMTPRELGQIQGFPAEYLWQGTEKQQIAQIGNAVPPPLAERVVRSLARVIFKTTPQRDDDAVAAGAEEAEEDEEEEDEDA